MSNQKTPALLGGILLVIGNVVGAGILALPMAIAKLGLPLAIFALFILYGSCLKMRERSHARLRANTDMSQTSTRYRILPIFVE